MSKHDVPREQPGVGASMALLNRLVLVLFTLALAAAAAPALASANPPELPGAVPSLQPRLTARLWERLVHRRRRLAATDCRPLRAVFYTDGDWLRLATKLAANESSCAQYYISIPPLAADKTVFRSDQARRIRALGPNFHVLAEVNYAGWNKWVAANGSSFFAAGQEARRRMATLGYDVAAGDSWVVNEFSSAVRANTGAARQNVRDLVHGLYQGDGTVPQAKGAVFITGIGQPLADLSTYKANLQSWYLDSAFWQDMSAYVSDWSQELYGDVRNYAVAGASMPDRRDHLNDYLGHMLALADVAPAEAASAASFIRNTYSPLANGAWIWGDSFGYTNVPLAQMQDYVTAQTYAMRSFDIAQGLSADHFGFAWAPAMLDKSPWTSDYATQSAQLLDRLAASIYDSAQSPEGACGTDWCTAAIAGGAFGDQWKTFASWAQQAVSFTSSPTTLIAGAPSGPISVQMQGTAASQSLMLSSSSTGGTFSTSPAGPWTSSLAVSIPIGGSAAPFYYRDTVAGTPTLTAQSAGFQPGTQQETVGAGPVASVAVSPSSATAAVGRAQTFSATVADAFGNPASASVTWSVAPAARGRVGPTTGSSTTFTAGTSGAGTVVATAGAFSASASVAVALPQLRVSSVTYLHPAATGRLKIGLRVVSAANRGGIRGASVRLRIRVGTALYLATTKRTGYGGALSFVAPAKARSGCYRATIAGVLARGYTWDGITPANKVCVSARRIRGRGA